jgi:CheY-like chemotaxis protein
MANGGLLTIESRNVHVDAGYARQHINLREGDYVALIVSASGGGIPAGIRDRIYDPFFTTKDASKGTGLGLAVVRGIVEQSGGHVWMYTEEGRGTTFKIFLPRYTADVIPQPAADEEAPPRGDETVLLVEDDELLRTVVREAMEEQGYRVLEARSPAEALTISSRHHNVIPLLLTDVIMPGMNGRALAEQIVAARPATRVIFMSGYTSHTVSNHAALPPSVRYLEKPISPSVLLRTMRAVLDES